MWRLAAYFSGNIYNVPDYVVSHHDSEAIQRIFICMETFNLVEPIFILPKEQTSFCGGEEETN
jgi:hypothetical protein